MRNATVQIHKSTSTMCKRIFIAPSCIKKLKIIKNESIKEHVSTKPVYSNKFVLLFINEIIKKFNTYLDVYKWKII